jgi:Replication initiator protein, pSAM2
VTAATATLGPEPHAGSGPGETADDTVITLTWAEAARELREAERTGNCHHPVLLKGSTRAVDLATGELRTMYATAWEPDGVLPVACGNRREAVCPPCSAVYKRDARQLVRAGLLGGKGIPKTVTDHPCVFATVTAPSFGPVHSRRLRGKTVLPCRPRRDHKERRCPHGRDISCPHRHTDTDLRLGRALCPECYDYEVAVLFNAHAARLWRRFTTYLPRHLARRAGLSVTKLRDLVRIRYVKVAEYQARGVVHFHAVIRLDAPGNDYQPPPSALTADVLCDAIRDAVQAVTLVVFASLDGPPVTLTFGTPQGTDVRPIRHGNGLPGTGQALSAQSVASYIAKYATKSLDAPGLPARPLKLRAQIDGLHCSGHYRRMMHTAWELASTHAADNPRLRRAAHALGWGGHFLTKSRRYSVTFGTLRRARVEHRKRQRHPDGERDPWGRPFDDTVVLILKTWTYIGPGCAAIAAAELALASADRARAYG